VVGRKKFQYVVTVLGLIAMFCVACKNQQGATPVAHSSALTKDDGQSELVKIRLQPIMREVSFEQPLLLAQAPGDAAHFYVLEKNGEIFELSKNQGAWQKRGFLDISKEVESGASEAGLLSMAFDPRYPDNGYLYVSYTARARNRGAALESRLVRFEIDKLRREAKLSSEKTLLKLDQPYANHNGGHLAFSADGYLFWGLGDGGSGGDPGGNGQNKNTLLGSLLRIDVRTLPYTIPNDNPFAKGGGRKEIYATGLRNPWRFSFDRNNGQLWVADVGQNNWEEIDIVSVGDNLGWNGREGTHCYVHDLCDNQQFKDPILEYDHSRGKCSVTGGYVYRGKAYSSLHGLYFYGDFCSGGIWAVSQAGDGSYRSHHVLDSGLNIASFAEDNDGELYVIHLGGGIYRIEAAP